MPIAMIYVGDVEYEVEYNYYRGFRGSREEPPEAETWEIESITRIAESVVDYSEAELEDVEYYENHPSFEDKVIDAIIKDLEDY